MTAGGADGLVAPGRTLAAGRFAARPAMPVGAALAALLAFGLRGGMGFETLFAGAPDPTAIVWDLYTPSLIIDSSFLAVMVALLSFFFA